MSLKDVYCELTNRQQNMVDEEIERYEANIKTLLRLLNEGKSLDDFERLTCPQEFNDMICGLDDEDQYVLLGVFEEYEYKMNEIKNRFYLQS